MKYEIFNNIKYEDIAKTMKVSTLVAKAIEAYNLSLDQTQQIKDPYHYKEMQQIVGYLWKVINEKKKIVIYGDYDVDGICSVAILKRMFGLLNIDVGYYIPNRYIDGYGLNCNMVNEIAKKNYNLIICIDNGINANDAISLARQKNIDVLVLDHHQLDGDLPNCNYFLHPKLSDFASYNMCASSIAYYLSLAMLSKDDEKCAILAGIATLSDIMPLVEQNRLLLKNAINLLNKHKYKNLDMLVDDAEYNENILAMTLIPKLNSVGRIIKDTRVNDIIKFLFEDKDTELLKYAKFVLSCNEHRKLISNEFFQTTDLTEFKNIVVVKNDTLIEGVCGIVASRIVNSTNKPAIVFAKSEDGKYYKGSARSIEGINIVELLANIDYIISFGGHEKAAGITINIDDFERLKNDLENKVSNIKIEESIKSVVLVDEKELTYKNYVELQKFGPFGEGNPYPLFYLKRVSKDKIGLSKDNKHLIIKLNDEVTLLGFNLANKYQEKYNSYDIIFTLDKNNLFKNKLSCKCEEIVGGK